VAHGNRATLCCTNAPVGVGGIDLGFSSLSVNFAGEMVEIWSKSGRIHKMKAVPARKSTQQKAPIQKHDSSISKESSGRPKLFADTDDTAELFNETSGRLDIRSVAEIYDLSISELARMINVEAKTAHKTPDSPAIHEGLIPFEEVARALGLMRGSVSNFRRWLNASNVELNYQAPLQMIRAGQIHELAGIVRSALLGQPD
jgi:hypothetical protein